MFLEDLRQPLKEHKTYTFPLTNNVKYNVKLSQQATNLSTNSLGYSQWHMGRIYHIEFINLGFELTNQVSD